MQRLSFLAFRNLRARLLRTLLTTVGIILGVAVILAISITNESTLASIEAVLTEASGKAHLIVESSSLAGEGFDQDVLGRVRMIDGVRFAVPSMRVKTLLVSQAEQWQLGIAIGVAAGNELLLYGINPVLDGQARLYRMTDGEFLDPGSEDYSIVLVEDYAEENEIELGQELEILTPEGSESLPVVGLMAREGPGLMNNGAFGVVPLAVLQKLFNRGRNIDQIDVVASPRIANSPLELEALTARLEERLGSEFTVTYPAARGKLVTQMLASYQQGLGFFSVVALFVGAFLIYNAFSMTVVERTREIGMLRAVGTTRGQILGLILLEAILLGTSGSLLGILGGIALAKGLISSLASIIGAEITAVTVPPSGLITSLLVGDLVTLISALLPAYRASRITPLEALRVRGRGEEGWLIQYGWLPGAAMITSAWLTIYHVPLRPEAQYPVGSVSVFTLLLGATLSVPVTVSLLERLFRPVMTLLYRSEGRLGGSNVGRAKGRTALTVAALMVGMAMIIGIGGMTESFKVDILDWVETAIGGDLYVRSPLPMRLEFGRRLAAVEGVADIAPVAYFTVRRVAPAGEEDDTLLFVALDPQSYTRVSSFQFAAGQGPERPLINRLAQGDAVFISTVVSDRYSLKQGDTLRLETARGKRDFYVAGIIVDFTGKGYVINGSWRDMRRYFGMNDVDSFIVKLAPGASSQEVRRRLEDLYGQRRHIQVESSDQFKKRILQLADQAFALLDTLALIGMIVAALGVINTLMMNVLERTREIGMLRGLGMTRWQVGVMILAEAGMMGLIGGLFGLGFGIFLSKVFVMAMNLLTGYRIHYVFPTLPIVISLLIALVVSQVAALYPLWRATRINIVEAVQFE